MAREVSDVASLSPWAAARRSALAEESGAIQGRRASSRLSAIGNHYADTHHCEIDGFQRFALTHDDELDAALILAGYIDIPDAIATAFRRRISTSVTVSTQAR